MVENTSPEGGGGREIERAENGREEERRGYRGGTGMK